MLTWFREKFGKIIVTVIIGLIAIVFAIEGIFFKSATKGMHEGAVAGTVNGENITLAEFNRSLAQQAEFFKGMMGGSPLTEDQIRMFRLRESTFQNLVKKKLMFQEAEKQGKLPSDEEIRQRISSIESFQKDGKFDYDIYKSTLEYNRLTPSSYERLVKEDLVTQSWAEYFRSHVKTSDTEVRRYFELSQDKRKIKFVLLTTEAGKKDVKVSPEETAAYLKNETKMNLVKTQYDAKKETEFKGKKLTDVQNQIAAELIASERIDEVKKINDHIADQVIGMMKTDAKSDVALNLFLKRYNVQVKTSEWISRLTSYIPGLGEAKDVMTDIFSSTTTGKAKKFHSSNWVVVTMVVDTETADQKKFESERSKIEQEVALKKERELYESWVKRLMQKARITPNEAVVGASEKDIKGDVS